MASQAKYDLQVGRAIQVPGEVSEALVKLSLLDDRPNGAASSTTTSDQQETPSSRAKEEVRFELVCYERVDPSLVDVRAKDYDSGSAGGKARKKIERVIGRSEATSLALSLSTSQPEKRYTVLMEVPEDFPPTFTGSSVSYAYKLRVGVYKTIPSKKGTGFREVEKSATTFPLCFWSSGHRPQAGVRWASDAESGGDDESPAPPAFFLTVAEVVEDAQGSGASALAAQLRPSPMPSPAKRRTANGGAGGQQGPSAQDPPSSDLPSPGSSLKDYASMPEFMKFGRRNSHGNSATLEDDLSDSLRLFNESAPQTYNIYCSDFCLCHLHVLGLTGKTAQPGCLLECVLDFPQNSGYVCARTTVVLVAEETVLRPRSAKMATSDRAWFETSEVCLNCDRTSFTFNVARDACPSFETDLVRAGWELRFAFEVGAKAVGAGAKAVGAGELQSSGKLEWKLPLIVDFH